MHLWRDSRLPYGNAAPRLPARIELDIRSRTSGGAVAWLSLRRAAQQCCVHVKEEGTRAPLVFSMQLSSNVILMSLFLKSNLNFISPEKVIFLKYILKSFSLTFHLGNLKCHWIQKAAFLPQIYNLFWNKPPGIYRSLTVGEQ